MASNPTDYEFMHWLGQFALYMKAEHNADIIKTILENPDLMKGGGLESALFLYQSYIAGESPKNLADRLIAAVDELHN